MEDLTGKQLGPYQITQPLGEGGMAAVYKAYQPGIERYVALKILPRHFAQDPEFVGRFQQEAKVLANLQHPHILSVHDYGEADGYTYIVMPFLESGTLTDLMRGQPFALNQIRRIISQVGDALDYAHQRGLIHRDVKPSNVLLDERDNCLLTDFGIAKLTESSAKLTATGGIIGTPAYMSPEQGEGRKLDGRSDIYSLGVVLYELATGRVPYRAETPMAVVFKHINDPLPPPRDENPSLPEAVERVILKSLAKKPEQRYATAGEMVRALRMAIPEATVGRSVRVDEDVTARSVAGVTIEDHSQGATDTVSGEKPSRSSLPWILTAIVILIVLGGVIILVAREFGTFVTDDDETTGLETVGTESVEIDKILYDDFDDPNYDGKWNPELWTPSYGFEGTVVTQTDGKLAISRQLLDGSGLTASELGELNIDDISFAETKIMLDSAIEAAWGDVGIVLSTSDDEAEWWFGCNIGGGEADSEAWAGCDSSEDYGEGMPVQFDTWHTLRFEIDPDTVIFSFFIDGQKIDDYEPDQVEGLKQASFVIELKAYSEDGGIITGYMDDVQIGLSQP